jgi:hypothetical protein
MLVKQSLWCTAVMTTVLSITTLYAAQQLPDAEWAAYFGTEDSEPKEFKISMVTPFGPMEFTQRVKPKGIVSIAGKEYRKSTVLHDAGPFANRVIETFIRIADDGLYQRKENGEEELVVPRPLTVEQTWISGLETLKFEGIEDFETFDKTIPACLKITVSSQDLDKQGRGTENRGTKYYQRGKGLIYSSGTGPLSSEVTKILSQYAGKK